MFRIAIAAAFLAAFVTQADAFTNAQYKEVLKALDAIPSVAGGSVHKRLNTCGITVVKDTSWIETRAVDWPQYGAKAGENWPTPVVWSGFEVGRTIKYPAASIVRDFGPPGANPVADAYRVYLKMPYDRETWDLTAAFYAVRPGDGYFTASPEGGVSVDDRGMTKFTPQAGGRHRILSVDDAQRARILEAFLWLCTEPPRGH